MRAATAGAGIAPKAPSLGEELERAAWARLRGGRMSRWQSQVFVGRYLSNTGQSLLDTVAVPARWAVGEPLPVLIGAGIMGRPFAGLGREVGVVGALRRPVDGPCEMLGAPRSVGEAIVLPLELRTDGAVLYSSTHRISVQLAANPAEVLDRLDSEATTDVVRTALDVRLVDTGDEARIVADDRGRNARWAPINFGLAYRIEVVMDGEVIGRAAGSANWGYPVWKEWSDLAASWAPGALDRVRAHPERTKFIVTGDPSAAWEQYRQWPFNKPRGAAWTGKYETPVTVARRWGVRGSERPGF